jgi:uncharacterized protein involved in exopolysaccharide biosynthesis
MPRTLDTPSPAPAAPGEVRWITVGGLLSRWPWLLFPAVLLCAAGIAVGLLRAPTYTARAELTVGRASVLSTGSSAVDQASANLAQVYSRLVASDAVTDRVARRTGASPAFVRAHVSAAPVVNTSVFAITAVGATRSDATRLSDAALEATTRYIGRRTDPVTLRRRVLLRFRAAAAETRDLQGQITAAGKAGGSPTAVRQKIDAIIPRLIEAQLRQTAAAATFTQSQETTSPSTTTGLEILHTARATTSDRSAYAQKLGLTGAAAGLLLGLIGASLRERRRLLRL